MFLSVEGASHWWISRTLWAILAVHDWQVALIAFHFLWSLRSLWILRDSWALDSKALGFLIFWIEFSTLIQNRGTLLILAFFREIAVSLVLTNGTLDKYCLLFSCDWVEWAIKTSVSQFTESQSVTLTAFDPVLVIAFYTAILFTIIACLVAFRTPENFPFFLLLQLLLLLVPGIVHLLLLSALGLLILTRAWLYSTILARWC